MKKVGIIVFLILLIDQATKIYVKTHFHLHESIPVLGDWFKITYVENPGAAYGFNMGGYEGKILLSVLRLVLVGAIIWWMNKNIKLGASNYFIIPMAMILAGAMGNLMDGAFYGVIFDYGTTFNDATQTWGIDYSDANRIAQLNFEGYNKPFLGCVVDMLHFPMFKGTYPKWVPIIGGNDFEFFSYIFNVADSAITLGLIGLLLFKKKSLKNIN